MEDGDARLGELVEVAARSPSRRVASRMLDPVPPVAILLAEDLPRRGRSRAGSAGACRTSRPRIFAIFATPMMSAVASRSRRPRPTTIAPCRKKAPYSYGMLKKGSGGETFGIMQVRCGGSRLAASHCTQPRYEAADHAHLCRRTTAARRAIRSSRKPSRASFDERLPLAGRREAPPRTSWIAADVAAARPVAALGLEHPFL